MLSVWVMCTGDKYPAEYVTRMQREVRNNLSLPHRFICITEHEIPGVLTMKPPTDFPGWFGKIGLFKPGVGTAQNLWLDIDCVITGSLDVFIERYGHMPFAALTNWAQSGHGGVQSSLMVWTDNKMVHKIYELFDCRRDTARLHGDQCFITELRDAKEIRVTPIDPALTASYKYHVRGKGVPPGCRVVIFHGKPDPDEVDEPWFRW